MSSGTNGQPTARERVAISTDDGLSFDGWLFGGDAKPVPGMLMIPEIFGVNRPMREKAAQFAGEGFAVLLLDIFWRLAPGIELYYDAVGSERAIAYHRRFDYDRGVADIACALQALRRHPTCNGAVSLVGYCVGGTMAYLAAARTSIDAAVGFYPTRVQNYLDEAQSVSRPLLMHFGENDHLTPPDVMGLILPAIEPNPKIEAHIYPGAGHAFANHTLEHFDRSATALADRRTLEFLATHLGKH